MNYARKTIIGTGSLFIFALLGAGVAYLARIYLARKLTLEEFGLFFAVFTMFSFFSLFKEFGLGPALVKYVSEFRAKNEHEKAKSIIVLSGLIQSGLALVLALVFIALSDTLATHYFKNSLAGSLVIILAMWFFTSTLQATIFQTFYGLQNFVLYSIKDFVRNSIYFLLLVIFLGLGFGGLSPAYAWLSASLIIILIFAPVLLRKTQLYSAKIIEKKALIKKLLFFGLPVSLTMVGGTIIAYFDTLMLTYFRTLGEVGVYNVILPTALIISLLGKSLGTVVFPLGSSLWATNDKEKLLQGLRLMLKYAFLITVPLALSFISFAFIFLRFFFGREFTSGVLAFQILIVGVVFYVIAQITNALLAGIGKPLKVTKIILVAGALNLSLNIPLIPLFGIEGAAVATTLSYILICVWSIYEVRKSVGFKAPVFEWLKTLVSGGAFVALIYLLRRTISLNPWIELIIVLLVAGLAYTGLVFALRLVTFEEITKMVKRVLKRD